MKDAPAHEILAALGVLVLVREPDGSFRLGGSRPIWYLRLFPDAEPSGGAVDVVTRFPFLESFLPTAENYWSSQGSGLIRSGYWVETYGSGTEVPLKADALVVEDTHFLLVEYVRSDFEHIKGVLQKAREAKLAEESTDALQESLYRSRARLSALLEGFGREAYRVRGDGVVLERFPGGPIDGAPTLDQLLDPARAESILLRGRAAMGSGKNENGDGARISPITSEEFWALLD